MYAHGTFANYTIGACRCPQCKEASRRYNNRRKRLIAYGQWEHMVDAEPVRRHIRELSEAGLGLKRISGLAGVSDGALTKLLYGDPRRGGARTKRVRPATATAILALRADLDTLADHTGVDATGTRRRIEALTCLGWSMAEQAGRLGWSITGYRRLHSRTRVSVRAARTVRALYSDLSMAPAPSGRSATLARYLAERHGYAPPLAWDDDTLDDPAARPDLGEKTPNVVAHLENLTELEALRCEPEEIAARLGVTEGYLVELRRRARLKEVAA